MRGSLRSAPPTPTGRGPARSAHETLGRTLQLLRSERPPSKSGPSGSRHATGLAQMAAPSQPAYASHVGAVQPIVGTLLASPPAGCRADMGGVATRHISGGAGWWKSPCPVLVRASGEQSPGATRPPTRFIEYRNRKADSRSAFRTRVDCNLAAVCLDNRATDTQADADAMGLCRNEWLEHPLSNFRGQPGPMVADDYFDHVALGLRRDGDGAGVEVAQGVNAVS